MEKQGRQMRMLNGDLSTSLQRPDDEWQTGDSFAASDLKHLGNAAREARTRIDNWNRVNKRY
jgi:hypothetical protein